VTEFNELRARLVALETAIRRINNGGRSVETPREMLEKRLRRKRLEFKRLITNFDAEHSRFKPSADKAPETRPLLSRKFAS
jgi:hypothetical protein